MGKLATVADSAGVGIRLLRYRCNGTRNAIVRCEKCCRKAFEASISKRSDKIVVEKPGDEEIHTGSEVTSYTCLFASF